MGHSWFTLGKFALGVLYVIIFLSMISNSTGVRKLSKKVHMMASPAVRSVNKVRDIKKIASETSHECEICVIFTTRLYHKALKIDFVWSDMANNL